MLFTPFQYIAAFFSWVFLQLFTKLEIHGLENLDGVKKPLIVVANHESHYDPQLVGVALLSRPEFLPVRYMAKNILFFVPGLNLLIWLLGAFPAHRGKGIEKSLKTPLAILKSGGVVIMFPEGRMIIERPKLGEGRRGAAMLSLMTGASLVPMSIHTPHDLPPIIPLTVGRPRIVIRVGKPFSLKAADYPSLSDENTARATKTIMDRIGELYFKHTY